MAIREDEITRIAKEKRFLSFHNAEFYALHGREDPALSNEKVLEDIISKAILHCWCGFDDRVPNDVLVYPSNRYYWVITLTPRFLEVEKYPYGLPYVPDAEKVFDAIFDADEKEYQLAKKLIEEKHRSNGLS